MLWNPCNEKRGRAEGTASDPFDRSGNVVTAAYYRHSAVLPLEGLEPLIYDALKQVTLQHPPLGPIVKSMIHLVQLQDGRDEEVDALVEEQQNMGFQQTYEQGLRLLIAYIPKQSTVSDVIVCFVVHEAFKGRFCGGSAFHRSFLAALLTANEGNPSSQQTKEHSHFTPIRSLSKMSTSRSRGLTGQSRFKTITLGTRETTRLLDISSSSKTNLTGVIQAVAVVSLFANLPSEITILYAEGRMSPREFHSLVGTMANTNTTPCFSYIETHKRQELTTASVWNEARRIHSATKAQLARKKNEAQIDSSQYIQSPKEVDTRGTTEETMGVNVIVTNMGTFRYHKQSDSQQQQDWQAGTIFCGNGGTELGATLSITLIVGEDECLTVGFSWSDSIIEEVWLDQVILTLRKAIEDLLYTSGTTKRPLVSDALPWGAQCHGLSIW
ncbi:uncharacterized protein N7446_005859 [Penicillium canescens]|uniref:Uncharacterized protein n=1 Tax=Penicillium canescens TaxID=5083 RepID=A0AAD6IIJ6_PENCN|nr:uncharacterized protein N7446_005859 [Penicillium canescens]KAJ6051227.1 hypothetical protein N7460_001761 [Penicillium canescens]KAJ6061739.1 hypothetical protein N7446_005859 [Penicillium canescens]KAJ6064987.1 hypothetical protein N7444_000640 [Penicillium canescens]